MADRETAWNVLQALFGEDVRKGTHSQRFHFNIARVCGVSDRMTGYSSKIM